MEILLGKPLQLAMSGQPCVVWNRLICCKYSYTNWTWTPPTCGGDVDFIFNICFYTPYFAVPQYYAFVEEKQKVHCLNTLFSKVSSLPVTIILLELSFWAGFKSFLLSLSPWLTRYHSLHKFIVLSWWLPNLLGAYACNANASVRINRFDVSCCSDCLLVRYRFLYT